MPNRKTKEAARSAKFAADEALARAARKTFLKEKGAQLKAEAAEATRAGKPSIMTHLPRLSVRQQKLQKRKGRAESGPKQRVFSKSEFPARRKNIVIPEQST